MTRALGRLAVVAVLVAGWLGGGSSLAWGAQQREAFVFLVRGIAFRDVQLLPGTGAALMSGGEDLPADLAAGAPSGARIVDLGSLEVPGSGGSDRSLLHGAALRAAWERIGRIVGASSADRILVIVACTRAPSTERLPLTPITMASGPPASVLPPGSEPVNGLPDRLRALTSDSTRRIGVVSAVDIVPTIRSFLGLAPGSSGSVIRRTPDPAPFTLYERSLADRRLWFPIQTAGALYVTAVGLAGIVMFLLRGRLPTRLVRGTGWLALSVIPLATALLAAGHLPSLSPEIVIPFVVGVTMLSVLAVVPLHRFGTSAPTAALGAAVLVYFAVEAALGWTAALTPFLGGSELDGGRFFGLPNVFIGLLIGSSLFVAARLSPWTGFALVAAVGLFAGLPSLGSNLGASIALFAAAGLWLVVRTRPRPGWQRFGTAAGVVAAGTGLVLLAHRYLTSTPTHVTRFEEARGGLGAEWGRFVDRLGVGWDLIRSNPFALVPVIGVVATTALVLWPPGSVRIRLALVPELAQAVTVTLVAGVVAYVANDSGPAATGLAFGLGLGGLLYVLLASRTGMMEAP